MATIIVSSMVMYMMVSIPHNTASAGIHAGWSCWQVVIPQKYEKMGQEMLARLGTSCSLVPGALQLCVFIQMQ